MRGARQETRGLIHRIRTLAFSGAIALSVLLLAGGLAFPVLWWGLLLTLPLVVLGVWDMLQTRHNVLRNYPILGHLRYLLEDVGPELHQYIVESNKQGRPFDRDLRSLMYQRAKNVVSKKPFGTELDVYGESYAWISHSLYPTPACERPAELLRVDVGGPDCTRPYSASVYNISAMSFGSLGANAVRALNAGAKRGGFAHDTGEGGISRYHREPGGDLIWEIGTGYFGCRMSDGSFDPERFREQARGEQVKMIELKLSQGAKPGHGGILPAAKISREIAESRGVPLGVDCVSPPHHTAFTTPIGLVEFLARVRELAGGKPVGFKLCLGDYSEFLGVCKAILETRILPDFVVVDGAEGGTGAAPIEFADHVGMPGREGLARVHAALVGIGVRDRVKVAVSGKLVTGFHLAAAMALGADWCNSARGFMFALGCIQAQRCHTNGCPVGVTTHNRRLQRGLVVDDKTARVHHFHRNTVEALAEVISAAGLDHPSQLTPRHISQRVSPTRIETYDRLFPALEPGQLAAGRPAEWLREDWERASAKSFRPVRTA